MPLAPPIPDMSLANKIAAVLQQQQTGEKYLTTLTSCTCLGFKYRRTCKHILQLTEIGLEKDKEDKQRIKDMEELF